MNRKIKFIVYSVAVLAAVACSGRKEASGDYDLRFNSEGKFRIMQLTDVHLNYAEKEEYDKAKNQMVTLVEREKPDLLIFTGDVVTGVPAEPAWKDFLGPLDEKGIPFIICYGNHDRERELTEYELAEVITAHSANINETDGNGCLADMAVKVRSHDGKSVKAVLYCVDSFDYHSARGFSGYGWFATDQVEWHRAMSNRFAEGNGGIPVPSYAFFHIPLPEYATAVEKGFMLPSGQKGEKECIGVLNSGMYTSYVECADVHGVFVGHDHVNDYIAPYGDIALTYGRFSGYDTTYGSRDPHGLRIIELSEGDYGFHTWVSLLDGGVMGDETFEVETDYTMHPAVGSGITLGKDEKLLNVPQNGLWVLRKTRGRGYEVAIDDIVICPVGNRECGYIALQKGIHKLRVTPVAEDAASEPFHLAWRSAGSGKMHEIPEDAYVK